MFDVDALPSCLVSKIAVDDGGCWLWTAALRKGCGYGHVNFPTRRAGKLAHRVVYELLAGPIPDGLQLDHLCRVRRCVNPAHLEPVTARENIMRGAGLAAVNACKTECLRGHPLSGENLYLYSDGRRACRECTRQHGLRYRAERALTQS